MECPCKDCKDRKFDPVAGKSCHSSCDAYKAFDEYNKAARIERQQKAKEYYSANRRRRRSRKKDI